MDLYSARKSLDEIPSECSQLYVARSPLPQTVVIDPRSFGVEPEVGSIDGRSG